MDNFEEIQTQHKVKTNKNQNISQKVKKIWYKKN